MAALVTSNHRTLTVSKKLWLLLSCALFCAQLGYYCWYGHIFLDAGFYLSAARLLTEGELPYRDFFFVQPPLYVYIYGGVQAVIGTGLVQARLISAVFGMGCFILSVALAYRLRGYYAAAVTAGLMGWNSFQAYHFVVVKLYALTGFLLLLGCWLLLRRNSNTIGVIGGAVFIASAVSTRLTLLPVALLAVVAIVLRARGNWRLGVLASGVMAAVFLVVFGPYLVLAREQIVYFLFGIHVSAQGGPFKHGIREKVLVLLNLIRYNAFALAVLLWTLAVKLPEWRRSGGWKLGSVWQRLKVKAWWYDSADTLFVWSALLAVTAAHGTANWFSADYESVVLPLFYLGVGVATASRLRWSAPSWKMKLSFGAGCLLSVLLYSANFTWRYIGEGPIENINHAAEFIAASTDPEDRVITCNAFYAIEANRRCLEGFAGAPFTFTPDWEFDRCKRFHSVNIAMLVRSLEQQEAAALILYPDSFSVGFPGFFPVESSRQAPVWDAVFRHYREAARFTNFHSYDADLVIYLPRP